MTTLSINGKQYRLNIEPETPLLWALRDTVNLTGTKYGCGIQQCGACTVLIKGRAVRSCGVTISEVAGDENTTIEGLSSESARTVQKAWIAEEVPQCGYCQSGQIMSTVALLATNPSPSEDEIKTALAGNICRCGTYPRILKAVKQAASSSFYDASQSPDGSAS